MPTYANYVPPSDGSEYIHYTPSKAFNLHLEFDYPGYWWRQEKIGETGTLSLLLGDPRFLTLPTPSADLHPTPNDFGSVYIWIMPGKRGQTPETELKVQALRAFNTLATSYEQINLLPKRQIV